MRRVILIAILIPVALLAIASGVGYWIYNNYTYYQTDDAQISGQLVNVMAPAAGTLTTLSVGVGDRVSSGQTIATVTTAPTVGANGLPTKAATIDVTSPINGTVVQAAAVANQAVAPGLPILQVTDLNHINVTAYVDESAINNIQRGQSVDITVDAYKDTKFSGHVQQIVPAAAGQFSLLPTQDNASGNFTKVGQRIPVVITLDNSGKLLMPGMSVEVSIHLH
ncbi:MAG: efflux RND transporter periplasmic adaptor subunit [Ktedonobacteraceae bacterium]|nr:efflux RND transporter periplasmic adaptor subunit [Ktedonobacteraceae bacterium]